jgi:hypothetical protein
MRLTILESHKFDFISDEISSLSSLVKRCDRYLEFVKTMQEFFLTSCRDFEEDDKISVESEIESLQLLKRDYENRIEALRNLSREMRDKPCRLYNQYYRMLRFPYRRQ